MDVKAGINADASGRKLPVIIYTFPSASSFVKYDAETLRAHYRLRTFEFLPGRKSLLPLFFIRQKLFLLRHITSSTAILCQFAGYHSLLPVMFARLFRKQALVVVGGTDCVSMPSVNYGNLRKPLLRWFTLKSLKWASHIISPGESLIECDYTYNDLDYPGQGFRYFDGSVTTPVSIIYNGVDTSHFRFPADITRKKNSFLTVCTTIDKRNYRLKGLDLFVRAAELFPEYEFTIIGRVLPGFDFSRPGNVKLISFVEHDLLPSIMADHTFYCQLSLSEGFGVALAEAMACGCVPIVSRVGIMHFIIGDTGFILDKYHIGMLKDVIEKAIVSNTELLGSKARHRVVENFNLEERKAKLTDLIDKQIGYSGNIKKNANILQADL